MTHIQEIQARNKANLRILLRLTNMSIEEYVTMQMDIAEEYLELAFGGDVMAIYKSEMFWKWFINAWNNRDAMSGIKTLYAVEPSQRKEQYRTMHYNWCIVRHKTSYLPQQLINDWYLRAMGILNNSVNLIQRTSI